MGDRGEVGEFKVEEWVSEEWRSGEVTNEADIH